MSFTIFDQGHESKWTTMVRCLAVELENPLESFHACWMGDGKECKESIKDSCVAIICNYDVIHHHQR